jgi:hypothetical protein
MRYALLIVMGVLVAALGLPARADDATLRRQFDAAMGAGWDRAAVTPRGGATTPGPEAQGVHMPATAASAASVPTFSRIRPRSR